MQIAASWFLSAGPAPVLVCPVWGEGICAVTTMPLCSSSFGVLQCSTNHLGKQARDYFSRETLKVAQIL